jgi:four helix bundle protein
MGCGRFTEKNERRTSNGQQRMLYLKKEFRETQRWLKLIQGVPLIKKPGLLDDILQERKELIKIFVTSIKTAEKKQK